MNLNQTAWRRCDRLASRAEALRIVVRQETGGPRLIDCGVEALGGLEAGRQLAEICMAGQGRVRFVPASGTLGSGPAVSVRTDHPVAACMAAQYAGWQIQAEPKFFAMGSGPMRAAAGKEELFERIGFREQPAVAVGVLETSSLPPLTLADRLASDCGVAPERLTLLLAATSSLAGTVQVVARSVETALHKLHELGFDLAQVVSGWGTAPLPPLAENDLAAIGRTNDAVLYGGQVTLWVDADDQELEHLGPRIPSCSSPDYGRPFGALFEQYERDFYRIDPLLFSPAVVTLINARTGRSRRYGELRPDVLEQSFA